MADTTTVVPVQQNISQEINPHSLFDAISYVEQQYSNECGGAETSSGLFTTKQKVEFWEVGFKSAIKSGFILALLTPIAVGVIERMIPVFGDKDPTMFDMMFAFLLSFGFPLLFALFLAQVSAKHRAGYTRSMIKSLMSGFNTGTAIKTIVIFLLFHFLALFGLSDPMLLKFGTYLKTFKVSYETISSTIEWFIKFRTVLVKSAYIVLATSVVSVLLPMFAYHKTAWQIKKDVEDGKYKQPKE